MAYTPRYRKKKPKFSWLLNLAALVFLCMLILGGGMFLRTRIQSRQDQQAFQDLAHQVQAQTVPASQTLPDGTEPAPEAAQPRSETESPYQVLYAQNPDFAAWLTVPGTKIDYPVMHTPEDIEYYIYRAFDGTASPSGTPFIGEYGDLHTDRCILYGHNMGDGTMFHDLLNYEEKAFWEENPTFTVATLTETREYEIFAAVRTRVLEKGENGFRYYQLPEDTGSWLTDHSLYDTGIALEADDRIVILSTCSYHTDEGRFLVAGRYKDE